MIAIEDKGGKFTAATVEYAPSPDRFYTFPRDFPALSHEVLKLVDSVLVDKGGGLGILETPHPKRALLLEADCGLAVDAPAVFGGGKLEVLVGGAVLGDVDMR